MRWLTFLALAGCVDGVPYTPTEPCPNVVVYLSFADTTLVTDSITYPECP